MKIFYLLLVCLPLSLFSAVPESVRDQFEIMVDYPRLEYPNDNYLQLKSYFDDEKVLIFVYDTLLNPESFSKTLKEKNYDLKLAAAFGLYRSINVDGKIGGFLRDATDYHWTNLEIGPGNLLYKGDALVNVTPISMEALINGAVIAVEKEDLKKLIDRYVGYDLIPLVVMDWQDKEPHYKGTARIAYTFSAPREPHKDKISVNDHISPSLRYMYRLRDGFYRSEDGSLFNSSQGWSPFRKFFEDTTFFGNGSNIWRHYYILN